MVILLFLYSASTQFLRVVFMQYTRKNGQNDGFPVKSPVALGVVYALE